MQKKVTTEEVIEFVKKTHDDFLNDDYSEDLLEQMTARSFRDWCDYVAEAHEFKMTPFMKKYFDFKQVLKDEWEYSACMGGDAYYLVRSLGDTFKLIECGDEFEVYYDKCLVVMIPCS
jgi:hypothetical protein